MNIAYLISAHTDPPQLSRLVHALHADAEYFIHIDRKTDITPFRQLLTQPNVHFLEQRIDVRWGTINEWDYQLALLRAALAHPTRFHRLVTLSGLDYPLWSNSRITRYFQARQGIELLAAMPMTEEARPCDILREVRPYITLPLVGNRTNQRIGILLRKAINLTGYRRSFTFTVAGDTWREYKGAAWWAISEELAKHVVETYDTHTREIRRYFRHQHCPAETLLQTIAFNSPEWRMRCVEFPCTENATLAEKTLLHHIDYTTSVRVWRTNTDLDTLQKSGKMFARKFTTQASSHLLSLIDEARLAPTNTGGDVPS